MDETTDSNMYCEILEKNLVQLAKHLKLPKGSWVFHYDNYMKYTVVKMRKWSKAKKIKDLELLTYFRKSLKEFQIRDGSSKVEKF